MCKIKFKKEDSPRYRHVRDNIRKKIQTAPTPKTKRQVRAFLGLTGYYREFIPNYAEISAPLTQPTKKKESNTVKWNATHEEAFDELNRRISSPPTLKLPDFTTTFVLPTDASEKPASALCSCNNKKKARYTR